MLRKSDISKMQTKESVKVVSITPPVRICFMGAASRGTHTQSID